MCRPGPLPLETEGDVVSLVGGASFPQLLQCRGRPRRGVPRRPLQRRRRSAPQAPRVLTLRLDWQDRLRAAEDSQRPCGFSCDTGGRTLKALAVRTWGAKPAPSDGGSPDGNGSGPPDASSSNTGTVVPGVVTGGLAHIGVARAAGDSSAGLDQFGPPRGERRCGRPWGRLSTRAEGANRPKRRGSGVSC